MSRKSERVLPPLRRYTTLPALLDLLKEKQLTLVSPTAWADRNDSFYNIVTTTLSVSRHF